MAGYPVVDAGPANFRPAVTPSINGTRTPVVAISGAAAAGAKHIDDASPTAAETQTEQIHWTFNSYDDVRKVSVGLITPNLVVTALSGTAGEVSKAHEVAYLKVTVNPGDDVTASTRLLNGYPEVYFVYPGDTLEIESDTAITDVYAIAALTSLTAIQGGASVNCQGASYV